VISQLPLLAYTWEIAGAYNLFCTNVEIMGPNATNALSKPRIANWLIFNHANDLILFTYFPNTLLHNHTTNFQSTSTKLELC
jgi:hypothetical protein